MAGFTPINASSVPRTIAPLQSRRDEGASDRRSNGTVASEYLGRDDDLPAAPPPKKSNTKGKKRAATAGDASKSNKRHRSSNIDDGLSITKSRPREKESKMPNTNDQPQKPSKSKKKSTTSKQPKKTSVTVGTSNADVEGLATKPISVYAQATSMDALDSTSARTSFDSVKANAGQSFTLYQGPSSTASFRSNVEFSQPLLSSQSKKISQKGAKSKVGAVTGDGYSGLITPQTSDDFDLDVNGRNPNAPPPTSKISKHVKQMVSPQDSSPIIQNDEVNGVSSLQGIEDGNRRSTRPKKAVNYAVEQSFPNLDVTQDVAQDQSANKPRRRRSSVTVIAEEEDFGELPEEEVIDLTKEFEEAIEERGPTTPLPRGRKQNIREVDEHGDYYGALISDAERELLAKMKNASEGKIKLIVRKPFQHAILDRSPIFGASKSTVLRTSFRVGEALNFGAQAVRSNENAIIELYARATFSKREGRKQHFVFKDLYHNKPPYLEGTYELWDQARLWDLDSKPFLKAKGPGILSRVIARMKRENQKWRLEILNVWEASWEDVNHVAGIYTGDVQEEEDGYNI